MVASLLTQLTNGIQDSRLYDNIQINQFIKQWKKTTRFTTQWHRVEFSAAPNFGKTTIVNIPTKGHLVGRVYFVANLPALPADVYPRLQYTRSAGHVLVERAEIRIGGHRVDQVDSGLLEVLDEFNTPIEKVPVVDRLIARNGLASGEIAVHLPFWFSSNDPHLWYPIDAVNVDALSVHITIRNITGALQADEGDEGSDPIQWNTDCSGLYIKTPGSGETNPDFDPEDPDATYSETEFVPPPLGESYLLVEYIYLDRYEANRLRVSPIEIPIPQHTILPTYNTGTTSDIARIPVRIGNPTKSLFFFAKRSGAEHPFANTSNAAALPSSTRPWATCDEPVKEITLSYGNNQIRYNTTFTDLFRILMPSLECTKAPYYSNYFYYMGFDVANHELRLGIPCGEANLDRIANAELLLQLRAGPDGKYDYDIHIYAITYNILHIYGGRAGLLFAY